MALHLGNSEKLRIYLNGVAYRLNICATTPTVGGIRLLSSDGYTLKDINGLYLITPIRLLSSDNYMLMDSSGIYLTIKEDE